jgi:acetylornithine/succinyldiaminopimelate/putrescine aminotransferase
LCDEHELLLLFDEVQCGMGRSGHYFAYQAYGVEPDAMSLAKALGNGFPIGAFVIQRRWEDVLGPGDHASTFGGSPLACAAGVAGMHTLEADGVLDNCRRMAALLRGGLEELATRHESVCEVRGLGLLLGVELDRAVAPVLTAAADRGVLLLSAGENVLRLLPPLTVTEADVTRVVSLLDELLGGLD